jgi:hypothetical protein
MKTPKACKKKLKGQAKGADHEAARLPQTSDGDGSSGSSSGGGLEDGDGAWTRIPLPGAEYRGAGI